MSPEEAEMREADAWLAWDGNQCGKPPLDLAQLERVEVWVARTPCRGVDFCEKPSEHERVQALAVLERSIHYDRRFPGNLVAYFEGWRGPHAYVIEIYGEGEPWPVQPEPRKPGCFG